MATIHRKKLTFQSWKFEWKVQDLWIGAYWKRTGEFWDLWICLIPCMPLHISWWFGDPEGDVVEWEKLNTRRIELAEKKSRGELQRVELLEFDKLQTVYFNYLDAKYPRTLVGQDRLADIEKRLRSD